MLPQPYLVYLKLNNQMQCLEQIYERGTDDQDAAIPPFGFPQRRYVTTLETFYRYPLS